VSFGFLITALANIKAIRLLGFKNSSYLAIRLALLPIKPN
jgi:hypothetical protein